MLAGRYRLEDRVQASPDGSIWRAVDETLERPVTARVMRPQHPFAADVADAARRAVLIDDPRLVRVLDVGIESDFVFIITEYFVGEPLTDALRRSPLAPEQARRVVGETGQALDRAGQRGLHHLRLRPGDLVLRPDGSVKVLGLAVEAAAAGLDLDPQASADRVDTVALAALLYAALTGRWPLEESSGLDLAPRQADGPVGVEVLAPDAPADLVELCAELLGRFDSGPRSPGELVARLEPWGEGRPKQQPRRLPLRPQPQTIDLSEPAVPAVVPAVDPAASPRHPAPAGSGHDPADDDTGSGLPTLLPVDPAQATPPPGGPPNGARPGARPTAARNGSQAPDDPPEDRPDTGSAPLSPAARMSAAAAAAAQRGAPAAVSAPVRGRQSDPQPQQPARHGPQHGPQQRRIPGPSAPHPLTLGDGVPRSEPDQVSEVSDTLLPWPTSWPGTRDADDEPSLGPFQLAPVSDPPSRGQSRGVIVALVGVLVLVLVFAVWSLRDVKPDTSLLDPGPTFTPIQVQPSSTPTGGATAADPTQAGAASKPVVKGALSLDPDGKDGVEHPETVDRAFDGEPGTIWRTDGYQTADFSGLKKGVGLVIDLGKASNVNQVVVEIDRGRGGTVELRSTTDPSSPGGSALATADFADDRATLNPPAGTVVPRYLVVWCTELPRLSGEKFRLDVAEITVR